MLKKLLCLALIMVSLAQMSCKSGGSDEQPEEPEVLGPGEVAGYTKMDHLGFVIQVQTSALANHGNLTNQALDKVKGDLSAIVNDYELAGDVLDSLRTIPFFIDWSKTLGDAVRFHVNRNWLVNNGYITEKLNSVEVSNVNNFLHFAFLNSPNMLLHEIAHLYHVKSLSVNYMPIYEAFVNARDSGIYSAVDYNPGSGDLLEGVPAHAISDQLNYFAELTETYFGLNDFYPFNREQLKEHDPQGFAVIEAVWKD